MTALVGSIADGVSSYQADMGVRLLQSGEALELFSHTGERLTEDQLADLQMIFSETRSEGTNEARFHPKLDAVYILMCIVDYLCKKELSLADLVLQRRAALRLQ